MGPSNFPNDLNGKKNPAMFILKSELRELIRHYIMSSSLLIPRSIEAFGKNVLIAFVRYFVWAVFENPVACCRVEPRTRLSH